MNGNIFLSEQAKAALSIFDRLCPAVKYFCLWYRLVEMPINLKGSIKMFHVLSDFWINHLYCIELSGHIWESKKIKVTTRFNRDISLQFYFQIEGEQTIDTFAFKGYVLIYECFGSRNKCKAAGADLGKVLLALIHQFQCSVGLFDYLKCNHITWFLRM